MADSPHLHGRGAQQVPSPPSANSPLSPPGASGTPISFRTNVNRAKTKRWVEAKQYSYDGGDWGDEDEEEEEEEEAPPVPQPPYATHRTGSSSELSSRRLSGLVEESRSSPSAEAKVASPSGGDQGAAPFIRPADIYKRMREEKAPHREAAVDSARPGDAPGSVPFHAPIPGSDEPKSERFNAPSVGLPEVKRVSGFGTDLFSGNNSSFQQNANPESQEPSLQHNPSQGFRSVVHQAFDVPETPNSTTGSVERSNSDGTSVVSPIMSSRGLSDDKTPTIPEEPHESGSPSASKEAANYGPVFKPGHRRDLSLPSSDNSPSKKPVVTDHATPTAGQAEMSSVSPHPLQHSSPESSQQSPDTGVSSKRASMHPPSNTAERDLPAPLKLGNNPAPGSDGYHGEIPIIVPASAGNSPQDTDNDRLREEIIRSLSRENTPEEPEQVGQQTRPQPSHEESTPHQPGNYLDGQGGPSIDDSSKTPVLEGHPESALAHPSAPVGQPKKPKLERRFSWESSDEDDPEPQIPGSYSSPPPFNEALATQEPVPLPDEGTPPPPETVSPDLASDDFDRDGDQPVVEKPRLSIIPPVAESGSPPEQVIPADPSIHSREAPLPATIEKSSIDESSLQGFRDILGIKIPDGRIRAFSHTRDQFAVLDTGLDQWLSFMVHEHPDHADVVQQSQSLSSAAPRTSPSRSRFPKLTSFGTLSSVGDSTPTSASHIRRPSGHLGTVMNRQNVEQRGKEFLHTAGTFSGKAGEAAKGLFAKGRSKFRPGGTDKGQSATARKSLQLLSSGSEKSHGNSSLRNSVTFGSLPMFKSGRQEGASGDPANLDDSEASASKRLTVAQLGGLSRPTPSTDKELPLSPDSARRASEGAPRNTDFAGDLEQEMIAALGLSPTETRPQQPAATSSTSHPGEILAQGQSARASTGLSRDGAPTWKSVGFAPPKKSPSTDKSLPAIPTEDPDSPVSPGASNPQDQLVQDAAEATASSIRPVDEDVKPPLPPKDYAFLAPRQASVSTLGTDERNTNRPSQSNSDSDPPSPLQPPSKESDDPLYSKPVSEANTSNVSLPSDEQNTSSYEPIYPQRPQSSAQVLESKRKSISGILQSVPGVQSPLRNEVRYSPGTRSSMMSFGSFGKQSANSKGTRPPTPANDLAQPTDPESPVQNEASAMGKLKSFGKRRRASMGDILSGFQGGQEKLISGIQGGQEKLRSGIQTGQGKRAFSRISGIFHRQQDSQRPENRSTYLTKGDATPRGSHDLTPSSTNESTRSGNPSGNKSGLSYHAPESETPASQRSDQSTPQPRDPRQRASMPLPPSASFNPLASRSSRFYSQLQAAAANGTVNTLQSPGEQTQSVLSKSRTPSPPSNSDTGAASVPQSLPKLQEQPDEEPGEVPTEKQQPEEKETQSEQEGQKVEEQDVQPQEQKPEEQQQQQETQPGLKDQESQSQEHCPSQQENQQCQDKSPQNQTQEPKQHKDLPVQDPQPVYELEQSLVVQELQQEAQQETKKDSQPPLSVLHPQLSVRSRKPVGSPVSASSSEGQATPKDTKDTTVPDASTASTVPQENIETQASNDLPRRAEPAATKDDSSEEIVMSPTAYPGQEWTPMHF
ncbi:hypothetical protein NUU61_000610 [Penicillium alfredii]|uniref:Uncharacterized protein n=1 Tax=Penicillium alfredii TaxID=1506179 RepID=A0A9W9G9Z8_9EURO|nr:uncharacterized protein NUU61_000610 [Penicillium alfredii]KAJ5114851.1 hypothetical protein NUU61_000610 [Penicillium alfredii]